MAVYGCITDLSLVFGRRSSDLSGMIRFGILALFRLYLGLIWNISTI